MRKLTITIAALALSGCAFFQKNPPPITTSPIQTAVNGLGVGSSSAGNQIISGLQNAAYNLDEAVALGILMPMDPAAGCVHGVLKQFNADVVLTVGMETPVAGPAGPTGFTPKGGDLIADGSIAYILAQQAKQLAAGGIGAAVPVSCEQIVGQFVIRSINAPINAQINLITGLLP